jgi:hypothetical protein
MSLIPTKAECKQTNRFITYTIATGIAAAIISIILLLYVFPIPTTLLLMAKTSSAWIV